MKLNMLHEATALNVALDVIGLIPGYGEVADAANVMLHIKQGEYFQAAMSLISVMPVAGDIVGKTAKYLKINNKMLAKHWPAILEVIGKLEKYKKYAKPMDDAVKSYLENKES